MKIRRKGASADHGYRSIKIDWESIGFNTDELEFVAKSDTPVSDFSATGSNHTYQARITLKEWVQMTKALATKIKDVEDKENEKLLREVTFFFDRIRSVLTDKLI